MTEILGNYFSYGSLKVPAYVTLPAIPTIVGEWASLLPLVCHLASQRCDYQIVGEIALRGYLHLSLFPRLGVLAGISRFLSNDSDFLDEASSKGGQGDNVYDVNWGSIFPCANGEASRFLIRFAAEKSGPLIHASDFVKLDHRHQSTGLSSFQKESGARLYAQSSVSGYSRQNSETNNALPRFRRYQTLRVIHLSNGPLRRAKHPWNKVLTAFSHFFVNLFCIPAVMTASAMVGAYGTAVILFTSLVTRLLCRLSRLQIRRPPGYLSNNESGDACMLMAIHQNANVWNLFIGDRGTIDTLLNKTMISFAARGDRSFRFLAIWFRIAHIFQLIAMTYVASQKGFDGIFLLVLMLITWALEWVTGGTNLARKWLEREGKVIDAHSFRFTGRMPLLGTVQQLSDSDETSWLDPIIAKCQRRDVWLDHIATLRKSRGRMGSNLTLNPEDGEEKSTPAVDPQWLELNVKLANKGYSMVKAHFSPPQATVEDRV